MKRADAAAVLSQQTSTSSPQRRALLRLSLGSLAALAVGRGLAACDTGDSRSGSLPANPGANEPSTGDEEDAQRALGDADTGGASDPPRSAAARADAGAAPRSDAMSAPTSISATPSAAADATTQGTGAPRPRAACARATTFVAIVDDAPRASFRQTQDSSTLDWLIIASALSGHLSTLPDRMLRLLATLGSLELGYPVSMLTHSLQTATRARQAGASDDLVLAALCHRLGMAFTIEGYAEVSAAIVRGYVSDAAYRIVRHHPEYAAEPRSTGAGPASDRRARYASQPWHADAVRFCDVWASPSYDPGFEPLPLSEFEPLLRAQFAPGLNDPYKTQTDCVGAG